MGKRSKRSITNEESYVKDNKAKIKKHVTVEPNSKDTEEPANDEKLTAVNNLIMGNIKKKKLNKAKLNTPEEVELNLDAAKEPAKIKNVKETEASNILKVVKEKKTKIKNHEQVELLHDVEEPTKEKKSKKSKAANKSLASDGGKAKIIFVDGEPQQVPASSGTTNKKFLNEDEAEVKDEDIDAFCDELDEEDNAQFKDWVKLIEAKLHSNKKKTE